MKIAALTALCLALFTAVPLLAQDNDIKIAGDEAVRRQALKEDLKRKLDDAAAAQKKGAFFEAAQGYTDCLDLVKRIGSGVEAEHKQALAGFIETRLQLAEQAQHAGDFAAADAQY